MSKIKGNYKLYIAIFIVLELILMLFLGVKKQYMYEDEVWSYTLSNGHTDGVLKFESGEWTTSEELFQQISVNQNERFDFNNVIYNQTLDAHPPLYAIVLHAICSLFPGTFSKWYGLSINFIALIFIVLFLYKQLIVLFDSNEKKALYVTVLFSLSMAMIIRTMYIRMYMILVVFTTLCMYIHIKKLNDDSDDDKPDLKFLICLLVTTFLGGMTHYYYFVFAFFVSAFYCVWLITKKRIKQLIQYVVTYIIAFALMVISYGTMMTILFTSDSSVLSENDTYAFGSLRLRVGTISQIISEQMFGGLLKPIILIVAIYCIWLIVSKNINIKSLKDIKPAYYMIGITVIAYWTIITLTAPYICDRHYFPVFEYIFLLFAVMLINISDEIFKSEKLGHIILFVFGIMPMVLYIKGGITDVNTPLRRQIASENRNIPCIFTSNIYAEENVFDLMEFDKTFYYDYESELTDSEIINASQLVVYVPDGREPFEYLQMLQQYNSNITEMGRLFVGSYCQVYRFY